MRSKTASLSIFPVAAAALLISLATSCKNSDTMTGPPAATPSPATPSPRATTTPLPATPTPHTSISIAGDWTGTFDPMDLIDCDGNTPAQATFVQNGTMVTGTLNATANPCGFMGVVFQGTLNEETLSGTVTGDRFQSATGSGEVSGTTLELTLTNSCPGVLCIPGGHMHLHR